MSEEPEAHSAGGIVYRCGVLIDGTGRDPVQDAALIVRGDRVAGIEPWDAPSLRDPSSGFHDFRDHTVIPGIIDGHVHLCYGVTGSASWLELGADHVGIVAWGLAGCAAALCSGTTTVVDVGSPEGLAVRLPALIDAGVAVGPTVIAAGAAITTTAGHAPELGMLADDAAAVVRSVRRCVASGARVIKLMVTGGASDAIPTNRRQAQYSTAELAAGITDAHRLGKRVVGHANATEGITRAVDAGIDIIAHCNWLGSEPGTVVVDPTTVQKMVRQSVAIDLNIEGALRPLSEIDGSVLSWDEADGPEPMTRWELLQPLRRAGVRLYLTSDFYGPAVASFTESLCLLQRRWQIPPAELIAMVTGEPAAALGIDDVRGTLAAERAADFVVLPDDLTQDIDLLLRPKRVYRNGRLVVADGRLAPPQAVQTAGQEAAAQQTHLESLRAELS